MKGWWNKEKGQCPGLWSSGTLRKVRPLVSCRSLLTTGWRHPRGSGGGRKSIQTAMLDLTPFLEVFLGVGCAEGKPRETERGWHEVHFPSVKSSASGICPTFPGYQIPNAPEKLPDSLPMTTYKNLSSPLSHECLSTTFQKCSVLPRSMHTLGNYKNGIKPLLRITINLMPEK